MGMSWQGRRVLVTGHSGFKGTWLSLWLSRLGANVVGYALAPAEPSLFTAARVGETLVSVTGDVRDHDTLAAALGRHRPEVVFHLAAQSLVRRSYREPVETYATNVMGTVHLLEAVRRCDSVRAVVVVSSDKCYRENGAPPGCREDQAMGGCDPYASSKGCVELVTAAYRASYFSEPSADGPAVAVATARAGNAIGGGDWAPERLVPDAIRAFTRGDPVVIRSPDALRPWQYVLEPLAGYLSLAGHLLGRDPARFAEAWNFGPRDADAVPVRQVLDRLTGLWGGDASWRPDTGANPRESAVLRLDIAKAGSGLDWRPRIDLDEALRWTVSWYREALAGADPRALCEAQIECFEQLSPEIG